MNAADIQALKKAATKRQIPVEKTGSRETLDRLKENRAVLLERMERVGKILNVAFAEASRTKEHPIDRLSVVFSDVNVCVGFMMGLAGALQVSRDTLENDAINSQGMGHSILTILLAIAHVSKLRADGAEVPALDAELAAFAAEALLEAPDFLEFCNEAGVLQHSDVSAVRWG